MVYQWTAFLLEPIPHAKRLSASKRDGKMLSHSGCAPFAMVREGTRAELLLDEDIDRYFLSD